MICFEISLARRSRVSFVTFYWFNIFLKEYCLNSLIFFAYLIFSICVSTHSLFTYFLKSKCNVTLPLNEALRLEFGWKKLKSSSVSLLRTVLLFWNCIFVDESNKSATSNSFAAASVKDERFFSNNSTYFICPGCGVYLNWITRFMKLKSWTYAYYLM